MVDLDKASGVAEHVDPINLDPTAQDFASNSSNDDHVDSQQSNESEDQQAPTPHQEHLVTLVVGLTVALYGLVFWTDSYDDYCASRGGLYSHSVCSHTVLALFVAGICLHPAAIHFYLRVVCVIVAIGLFPRMNLAFQIHCLPELQL